MYLGDVTVELVGWNTTTQTHVTEKDQVRQGRKFDRIYDWATDPANEVSMHPTMRKLGKLC